MSINERLKILISALNLSARAFSQTLEVSESTTRNYLDKGTKPSTDYLERIASHFTDVNLTWLITGKGEPLMGDAINSSQTTISGNSNNVASGKGGKAVQNNYTLTECERERDSLRAERESLRKQIELLNGQLQMQETIIKGKDELLDVLRNGISRPN